MILSEYASTLGAQAPFTDKRLSMTVDEIYRLQLLEREDGRILVRARLKTMPEAGGQRDDLFSKCARLTCGRMLRSAATCAVDNRERALWLQQLCDASSAQNLDEQVGAFVNELAFWVNAVVD